MHQKLARARTNGRIAGQASAALFFAGMAISGCGRAQDGQPGRAGGSPDAFASGVPHGDVTRLPEGRARENPPQPKIRDAAAAAPQRNDERPKAASLQTFRDMLSSEASSRVWELRERINATPDQDLTVTVTLQIGAGGHPVSLMGATASTRGGATRDVSDIIRIDTAGISLPPAAAKRQTTISVVIPGE